jgi:hypothetical protein
MRPLLRSLEVLKTASGQKKKAGHYSGHFTINTSIEYPIPSFSKVTITGDTRVKVSPATWQATKESQRHFACAIFELMQRLQR